MQVATPQSREEEILAYLHDAAAAAYSQPSPHGMDFEFFLDLEHGYTATADSRLHLFADEGRWALVMEKIGYTSPAGATDCQLNYFGNCVDPVREYSEIGGRDQMSNTVSFDVISGASFESIENRTGTEDEQWELVDPTATAVMVKGQAVDLPIDAEVLDSLGIPVREWNNPRRLIDYGALTRYLAATNPVAIRATDLEIRRQLPADLPKLMTIDRFQNLSLYERQLPSDVETYRLIAKVLATLDTSQWQPTVAPNNHWSKWESGHL